MFEEGNGESQNYSTRADGKFMIVQIKNTREGTRPKGPLPGDASGKGGG